MKLTLEDYLSLLRKYTQQRATIRAVIVTPSLSGARVTGTIRVSHTEDVLCLFVVNNDGNADQIKFLLSDCQFSYGDFRESKRASENSVAHSVEAVLTAESKLGDTLTLFGLHTDVG